MDFSKIAKQESIWWRTQNLKQQSVVLLLLVWFLFLLVWFLQVVQHETTQRPVFSESRCSPGLKASRVSGHLLKILAIVSECEIVLSLAVP